MSIFEKIISREIPADIVHETDDVIAFRDINPQAPSHVLIIPKRTIPRLNEARIDDRELLGTLLLAAAEVARKLKLDQTGYRVVLNNGKDGGESVPHLHVHLLGGRHMRWPPG